MKRYIRCSDIYQEDYLFDDEDDDYGKWTAELYETHYSEPIYKHFSTGEKALQYAKKVQDRFEEIYINRITVNGPSNMMVYEDGKWYGHL